MKAIEIEVFATGIHTSKQGKTLAWSRSDLVEKATEFNTRVPRAKAPATIGHPTSDKEPAYGYAESFSVRDRLDEQGKPISVLVGHYNKGDFNPEFVDAVKAGFFRERSLGIRDNKIDHVAWLGAVPPAVKGLAPFCFSAPSEEEHIEEWSEATAAGSVQEFADWRVNTAGAILRRLREWFIENSDLETADRIIPSEDLDRLSEQPFDETNWMENRLSRLEGLVEGLSAKPTSSLFSEGDMNKQQAAGTGTEADTQADFAERLTVLEQDNKTLKADNEAYKVINQELKGQIEKLTASKQEAEFSAFLASDEMKGRVTPAMRQVALGMLKRAAETEGEMSFSEGGVTKTGSHVDAVKAEMKTWAKLDLTEFARSGETEKSEGDEIRKRAKEIAAAR